MPLTDAMPAISVFTSPVLSQIREQRELGLEEGVELRRAERLQATEEDQAVLVK